MTSPNWLPTTFSIRVERVGEAVPVLRRCPSCAWTNTPDWSPFASGCGVVERPVRCRRRRTGQIGAAVAPQLVDRRRRPKRRIVAEPSPCSRSAEPPSPFSVSLPPRAPSRVAAAVVPPRLTTSPLVSPPEYAGRLLTCPRPVRAGARSACPPRPATRPGTSSGSYGTDLEHLTRSG